MAQLPFQNPRRQLPNNRQYVYQCFEALQRSLQKKNSMKENFMEFMQGILRDNHAERASPLEEQREVWYLRVYHPWKPGKIRVVFDSCARYEGMSLNIVLLPGPNLNNGLLGELMRFRRDPVAIIAGIQQMFYCFLVQEEHRDVLRFLWFKDNDPGNDVVDYRMRVHVFGNSPFLAVATYGLKRSAEEGEEDLDDALRSFPTEVDAIDLLKRAQELLGRYNIKLHKTASNRTQVMDAFPKRIALKAWTPKT